MAIFIQENSARGWEASIQDSDAEVSQQFLTKGEALSWALGQDDQQVWLFDCESGGYIQVVSANLPASIRQEEAESGLTLRPVEANDESFLRAVNGGSAGIGATFLLEGVVEAEGISPQLILDGKGSVVGEVHLYDQSSSSTAVAWLGLQFFSPRQPFVSLVAPVRRMCQMAFAQGIHAVHAASLPEESSHQRILRAANFRYYGFASEFAMIKGQWRDHILWRVMEEDISASSDLWFKS